MTKVMVFLVSGCIFIERLAPVDWTQLLIFLGMINYIVANAASNQCG